MRESSFWVLTGLAGGPQYGYGLTSEVSRLSQGSVRLRLGSLYSTVDRLVSSGFVEIDHEEIVDGRTRRYYRITEEGDAALASEAERMRVGLAAAQSVRPGLPGPGLASVAGW